MEIFANIKNGCLYKKLEGAKYRNMATGVEGEISEEIAQRNLVKNESISKAISENPLIEEMILKLKLITKHGT